MAGRFGVVLAMGAGEMAGVAGEMKGGC